MRGQIGKIDFSIELRVTQQNWRIRRKNIQQLQKYLFFYFWRQELCQQCKGSWLTYYRFALFTIVSFNIVRAKKSWKTSVLENSLHRTSFDNIMGALMVEREGQRKLCFSFQNPIFKFYFYSRPMKEFNLNVKAKIVFEEIYLHFQWNTHLQSKNTS